MRLGLIIPTLLLVGCSSVDMLQAPGAVQTSKYGPVNQATSSNVGAIQYMVGGLDSITQSRRENAFKQMFDACKGKYEIVDEHTSGGGTSEYTPTQVTGAAGSMVNGMKEAQANPFMYRVIVFKCV